MDRNVPSNNRRAHHASSSKSGSKRSPWSVDGESPFRRWTPLERGTCKHPSYPKRKRNESFTKYVDRVMEVLNDERFEHQEDQACLTAQVARDPRIPARARAFAEEGLKDMRRRMRDAKKDEIVAEHRNSVRKYRTDVRNGVLPRRAYRSFVDRKPGYMSKVRAIKIWDKRSYGTKRLAKTIAQTVRNERAVAALAGMDRSGLTTDARRNVLNRSNVRRVRTSPSRTPSPTYAPDPNDDQQTIFFNSIVLPSALSNSVLELERQSNREFELWNRTGAAPRYAENEVSLRRKWDLLAYAQAVYFDVPNGHEHFSTFSSRSELMRYVRAHPFPRDRTWSRLRSFVLAMNDDATPRARTRR